MVTQTRGAYSATMHRTAPPSAYDRHGNEDEGTEELTPRSTKIGHRHKERALRVPQWGTLSIFQKTLLALQPCMRVGRYRWKPTTLVISCWPKLFAERKYSSPYIQNSRTTPCYIRSSRIRSIACAFQIHHGWKQASIACYSGLTWASHGPHMGLTWASHGPHEKT